MIAAGSYAVFAWIRRCVLIHGRSRNAGQRHHNALIVADLSNDATYAEVLLQTFGARVIGLQISRNGDGLKAERRPVGAGSMLVYTIGRSHLLELFHSELQSDLVRIVDGPMSRRVFEQLANLETELRESGTVYKCLSANTTTSASPAPCWPGRRATPTCRPGPASLASRFRAFQVS